MFPPLIFGFQLRDQLLQLFLDLLSGPARLTVPLHALRQIVRVVQVVSRTEAVFLLQPKGLEVRLRDLLGRGLELLLRGLGLEEQGVAECGVAYHRVGREAPLAMSGVEVVKSFLTHPDTHQVVPAGQLREVSEVTELLTAPAEVDVRDAAVEVAGLFDRHPTLPGGLFPGGGLLAPPVGELLLHVAVAEDRQILRELELDHGLAGKAAAPRHVLTDLGGAGEERHEEADARNEQFHLSVS